MLAEAAFVVRAADVAQVIWNFEISVLEEQQHMLRKLRPSRLLYKWRIWPYARSEKSHDHDTKASTIAAFIDTAFAILIIFTFMTSSRYLIPTQSTRWREAYTDTDLEAFDITGPIDLAPLRDLCAHRPHQPGLLFECNESDGGVGNIRNSLLLCTRYAIEVGGEMIMPRIKTRNNSDLALLDGPTTDLSYLFQVELFRANLLAACPQIRLYPTRQDVPGFSRYTHVKDLLDPSEFGRDWLVNTVVKLLRTKIQRWVGEQIGHTWDPKKEPVLIGFKRVYFGWHREEDDYSIWSQWAKILRVDREAYLLAMEALTQLARIRGASVVNTEGILHSSLQYVGAHLRTEADASDQMKLFGFDQQVAAYIEQCNSLGISALYIASGDDSETIRAKKIAEKHGVKLYTKYSLLKGNARKTLLSMTFDQQALVDYLVLLRSTKFVGVDSSSFSGNIAITRHVTKADGTYWHDWSDEFSTLVGGRHGWLRLAIWP